MQNIIGRDGSDATLILGMHRSGTSLLASLIQALGVDLGDKLFPGDEHNPTGYFEDQDCVTIHERMLDALGQMPWHGETGMQPMPPAWWRAPDMQPLVGQLEQWLDQRLQRGRPWGLKDPRTTRFLPMWRELLERRGVRARFLLAVRDPAEVAGSIATRDAAPARRIQQTWLRFNMEALLHAGDALVGVFDYADWFADGLNALRLLSEALGVQSDDAVLRRSLDERLRPDLHRQRTEQLEAEPWARQAYAFLREATRKSAAYRRCAAELEFMDALVRRGISPSAGGPLEVVLSSSLGAAQAMDLAHALTARGRRVTIALSDAVENLPLLPDVACVTRTYEGPDVGGWRHTRAAHLAWRWHLARDYAAWHVIGGDGLAAHLIDARRQGWGAITPQVHYRDMPRWLRDDGLLHFFDAFDVEAAYLEARVLADGAPGVVGEATLIQRLRDALRPLTPPRNSTQLGASAPLVSICITHYNRPELLADCLRSVHAQTWSRLEVLLVDDGSTRPEAVAFLDSLEAEFVSRHWRLIRQPNTYLGAARNVAARAAQGKYLFFLDDDNLLHPEGVARAVQVAERTGADVVTALMNLFSGPAGTQPRWPSLQYPQTGHAALLGLLENTLGDANALVRRSCWEELGGFTEDRGRGAEDWEFFAKAILSGRSLELCLLPCSWYRVDAASMSRAGDAWADYRRALRAYEALLPASMGELPAFAGAVWRRLAEIEPLIGENAALRTALNQLGDYVQRSETEKAHMQTRIALYEEALDRLRREFVSSSSWRLTAPMRAMVDQYRKSRHAALGVFRRWFS